jgi:hypothetical protein
MTVSVKAPTSTTGSIQLNGSDVLTIDSSGNVTAPNKLISTGHVLQVVQSKGTTSESTTGNSYVASSLSASITPSSTSSKILIQVSSIVSNTGNGQGNYTIYRGATNLAGGAQNSFNQYYSSSGYSFVPLTMVYLDSPATTSSTTYTVYFKTASGSTTTYLGSTNIEQTITLMEIAG